MFTGLSGSGKSSLAFDTIYAEGQRRYVESLSAYARQFLEMMQKPDVDQIDGLSPAISIEQKTTSKNPRSTVGTVTEIYDYMRLLWARVGIPYSPATGLPIESQTVSQMVDRVLALPEKTRLYLLAPVVRGRKGEYRKEIAEFQKKGFQRLKIDGEFYAIDEAPALDKKFKHDIDVVVDRIVVRPDIAARLAESFETALELADGIAVVEFADDERRARAKPSRIIFSSKFACPVSGFTIPEIEPRLFSFNNPFGACPTCGGIGHEMRIDAALVVPDETLTLEARRDRALGASSTSPYYGQTLEALARHYGFKIDEALGRAPREGARRDPLRLGRREAIRMAYDDGLRAYEVKKPFEGVITEPGAPLQGDRERLGARRDRAATCRETPCEACNGNRLKPEALAVKIAGFDIGEATALSVRGRRMRWFGELPAQLTPKQNEIAGRILKEIRDRLTFLVDVGPRIPDAGARLRHAVRRREPAHPPREPDRLRPHRRALRARRALDRPAPARQRAPARARCKRLRDLGNTVIVVEHDEDAILQADYVVDVGPGAGIHGGEIVAQGTPAGHHGEPELAHRPLPHGRAARCRSRPSAASASEGRMLKLVGARGNNLKNVTAEIPLGLFTCITGVSGGGKSTLVIDTLYKAVARKPQRRASSTRRRSSASRAWSTSTRSSTSTSRRSAARRARTRRPTSAPSRRSANGSPACPRRRRAATGRAASPSTSRAGAARPARATASSRSRCTSCPTSTSPATSARASATTARRWR